MKVCVLYDRVEVSGDEMDPDDLSQNAVVGAVKRVRAVLSRHHEVVPIRFRWEVVRNLDPEVFDVVFNLCEGINGDARGEPQAAALLDLIGVPYTGSDSLALGTCLHKDHTKALLAAQGIQSPREQVFESPDQELDQELRFPLIVKPVREDAGIGVRGDSVVADEEALREQVARVLRKHHQPALVEEYIEGRELNVALIGNGADLEVLPISEIVFDLPPGVPSIVGYEAKWILGSAEYKGTTGRCPAPLDDETESCVREASRKAFLVTGCRDYARVDIRLRDGVPYVLEVNPNPDIDVDSGFFRSAMASGMTFEDLIRRLLAIALERERLELFPSPPRPRSVARSDRLVLRPVCMADIPTLLAWFNDKETGRFMDEPGRRYTEESIVEAMFLAADEEVNLIALDRSTERPIGYCSIYNLDRRHDCATVSFLIGERELRGKGLGVEMTGLLLEHAFNRLGLHRVVATVTEGNHSSVRIVENCGFRRIGTRRRYHQLEDGRLDEHIFEMMREDFELSDEL